MKSAVVALVLLAACAKSTESSPAPAPNQVSINWIDSSGGAHETDANSSNATISCGSDHYNQFALFFKSNSDSLYVSAPDSTNFFADLQGHAKKFDAASNEGERVSFLFEPDNLSFASVLSHSEDCKTTLSRNGNRLHGQIDCSGDLSPRSKDDFEKVLGTGHYSILATWDCELQNVN